MRFFRKIWPILILLLFFVISSIIGNINAKKFYKHHSNSIVISRTKSFGGYDYSYRLSDGFEILSLSKKEIDIDIGDSIVKYSNTWHFSVFKKTEIGSYLFNKEYDYYKIINRIHANK